MSNHRKHPAPKTERERRLRIVQMLRVEAGEIDVPSDPTAVARRPTTRAQRRRIVEVLKLSDSDGEPTPLRARADPLDISALAGDRERQRVQLEARFAAEGLRLDHHGRVLCDDCNQIVVAIPRGRVYGTTPTALRVWHKSLGCR